MKSGLLLASAVVLCALATGCANINLARRDCHSCTSKAGCNDMACAAAASAGPAGVAPAAPEGEAAGPVPPGAAASAGPYDPSMVGNGGYGGGYGGGFGGYGRGGHFGRGWGGNGGYGNFGPGGPPSAQVAYPYYTTRGPRDFLMNNPPSIGY